ncbi:hypothetical protein NVP1161O_170 [Vibrio phage 1.161.O._10N.261.48.C5]|nr:hypothetical protein NVP1161O_170 [Vibrio phage 1.161.O._10N.261.48.C5]
MTYKLEDFEVKEVEVYLGWVESYHTTKLVEAHPNKPRGSNKAMVTVPIKVVTDIDEFCRGFILGSLYEAGLTLEDVEFCPADTIDHVNTKGKPIYVFQVGDNYEIETWFKKK